MSFFKYPFWFLYRVWFYILVAIPIIILFPLLIISISREEWYRYFFKLARIWSKFILIGMGFGYRIIREETPNPDKSYMFVANHT